MKTFKIGLLGRIIIAIIAGIICGNIFPHTLTRAFITFNGLFSEFLTFCIPLIIVGLVTPAISDYGKGAKACSAPPFCWHIPLLFFPVTWPISQELPSILPSARTL